jgi:DNA-binding response OmpR family regulator
VRVLVAEDEERLAAALARGLTHAGFTVDVAHDGAAVLQLATSVGYDAILLDIMLPNLSGYEITRRLRSAGIWTPILMASAKDGEYDQADGLDLGADDYITKPYSFVVLLARLRALLRRGTRPRPTLLSCGELSFDPVTRAFQLRGEPIDLTARESAMLEYLIRHNTRTVTKSELLEHVWPGTTTAPNAVEVYAGYLRRKLGHHALQTVRGAGYRLCPP